MLSQTSVADSAASSPVWRPLKLRYLFGALLLLLLVAAGYEVGVLYGRLVQPVQGYDGEQFVEIPPGASVPEIGQLLVDAGVVSDPATFRWALRLTGEGRRLQSGEYRFDRPLSAVAVVRTLASGSVHLVSITFPEGLRIDEMAQVFESSGFGTAASFSAAAADPEPIRALDPDATDLEGYLFPDTYRVPRVTSAEALVRVMTQGFLRAFDSDLRQAAAARELSVRQVVTLASLVEKETARADERAVVAGVYTNRLRIGMGLQCDPTVIYALHREGLYDGNLTRANLQFDSPYNTYRYPGLPPGPIAAPGRAAFEAAVHPADVDYLFFVSRNDGSHAFARTLREHNRNVREHQIQYFRDRRRQQARRP